MAEIYKQLSWLEENCCPTGSYLAGEKLTHADLTWFPTTVFMEFMLPRVLGWSEVFHEKENFPKLTAWNALLRQNPVFQKVHAEIWDFWVQKEKEGQFDSIRQEVQEATDHKWVYP